MTLLRRNFIKLSGFMLVSILTPAKLARALTAPAQHKVFCQRWTQLPQNSPHGTLPKYAGYTLHLTKENCTRVIDAEYAGNWDVSFSPGVPDDACYSYPDGDCYECLVDHATYKALAKARPRRFNLIPGIASEPLSA